MHRIFNVNFIFNAKIVEIIMHARFVPNIISQMLCQRTAQDIRNNAGTRMRIRNASPAARSRNYQTNYPSSMRSTPFKTE